MLLSGLVAVFVGCMPALVEQLELDGFPVPTNEKDEPAAIDQSQASKWLNRNISGSDLVTLPHCPR